VFNFKEDFKRWVKVFYTDISSCVPNNGYASPFFNLNRGVRQGCPLSGLLFVQGIKLLNLAIQTNSNIMGIKVGDKEINTLYADDTTLFVKDLESVQELPETLEKFRRCSGFELNKSKTEAMWLGSWAGRKPFGFRWPEFEVSAYALGIHFTNHNSTSNKLNCETKLQDLQRILDSWKRRKLTLLGKINIVKSLGLAKLTYNASVLPLPKDFDKQVNKTLFDFIWDNKPHKIKNNTLIGDRKEGGLKMTEFDSMNKALKASWVRRFHTDINAPWKIVPNYMTQHLGGFKFLLSCNYKMKELTLKNLPNFYVEILKSWNMI